MSNSVLGLWDDFPINIPRRGDMSRDGIVHAIMLKSGQVLFITADETTERIMAGEKMKSLLMKVDIRPHPGIYGL